MNSFRMEGKRLYQAIHSLKKMPDTASNGAFADSDAVADWLTSRGRSNRLRCCSISASMIATFWPFKIKVRGNCRTLPQPRADSEITRTPGEFNNARQLFHSFTCPSESTTAAFQLPNPANGGLSPSKRFMF